MKVALINLGVADYTTALAGALADRVDVTLVEPPSQAAPWRPVLSSRVRLITSEMLRMRDPRSLFAASKLLELSCSGGPDLLHIQDPVHPWFDIAAILRNLPPLIVTVHDAARHPGENSTEWFTGRLRNVILRRAEAVIVHCESQKRLLSSKWGIPRERTYVIPHGELGSLYENFPGKPTVTASKEPDAVLFFGRIVRYKGIDVLLAALKLVQEVRPTAKLILAGCGERLDRYFPPGLCRANIEIIDRFIPHPEVAALFRRAQIAVLPYLEASQSGVASLAMGLGIPVIASKVGGLAELIRDGEDGVLVAPGDHKSLAQAILRLLHDGHLRERLALAALTRCRKDLSWGEIASQTVDLYREVLRRC